MKISLKWLSDYVDVGEFFTNPVELEEILTSAGLEVDAVVNYAEQFKNVVVGHIVQLEKHPNADKLTYCQVDVGEGEPLAIVCGASNHKQGDKVVVAKVGAVLPGDFKIKKSKIRDVESFGMLCSEVELGLADESPGIMILGEDAPIGQAFAEYQGLDDLIFDLSVTPNRADCLSHWGLAREIACIKGKELKKPSVEVESTRGSTKDLIGLELKDSDLCPRYAGRVIREVKVGPSPAWLKNRLEAVDINSINNIVDVTNYVMMELGQPLHAFDTNFLKGGKIEVARAASGEKFTTLDGTEVELTGNELTIRDIDRPVALAGVVGGLNSGVSEATQDIFIESAHFVPQTVRKTSRHHGIETDSGYRFARGTDPDGVTFAMDRTCFLIQQVAGGTIASDWHDAYPSPAPARKITARKQYVEDRLGYKIDMAELVDWLERLGCQINDQSEAEVLVTVPKYRWDLEMEVDLVEEFARLHGYDKIPESLPSLVQSPTDHAMVYVMGRQLVSSLKEEGYCQCINYGFTDPELSREFLGNTKSLNDLGVDIPSPAVMLQNPISEDLSMMRVSLLPGLFKNLLHNYRHGSEYGRQFELGFVFGKKDESYFEPNRLGFVAWGQQDGLWQKPSERPVVYDLKATIENLLLKLNAKSWDWRVPKVVPEFLHPGQTAGLFFEGRMVGFIGGLHPERGEEYKLRCGVALGEFDVEKLMRGQPKKPKLSAISKYPAVTRDFAFLLPKDLEAAEVVKFIKKAGGQKLQHVEIFDLYEGDKVAEGQRSVAFRLLYQDQEGTLTEDSLTDLQKTIIEGVVKKFGVEVR